MKKNIKKWIGLSLSLMLLLSNAGCMCAYLTYQGVENALKTPVPTAEPALMDYGAAAVDHPDVHFDEMQYDEPDIDALSAEIAAIRDALMQKTDPEAILQRFDTVRKGFESADSELGLLYVYYAKDVTNTEYQDQYADLIQKLQTIDIELTDLALAILDSPDCGALARESWSEDFIGAVKENKKFNSPEIQDDLAAEQELTFQYDNIINGYTYEYDGKAWTIQAAADAFYAGELELETYLDIYTGYNAGMNGQAGAIYLELLKTRTRIAQTLGYGSYAAYCYEQYTRDYTLSDAKALHAAVKKYIVPLNIEISENSVAAYLLNDVTFSKDGYLAALQRITADFSPDVNEALNYMLRNGLGDFDDTPNKMVGSFTTYFSNERAPYLFTHWEGSADNVRTVIHELGHFTRFYQGIADGWCVTEPLDIDEVDSQGLELLFTVYYDTFFGGNVDAAVTEMLSDGMHAMISGCMEDEFQQAVYENPAMTISEMNTLYKRLAVEYGLDDLYGYEGTEWVMIPHTFQSPMYYISYAVSIIAALEIYKESLKDYDAARDDYLAILKRPAYSEFRATMAAQGLTDPLAPETVRELSLMLADCFGIE